MKPLRHPLLSLLLFVVWLLLVGTAGPGQLLLGAVLAAAIPHLLDAWIRDEPLRLRRPLAAVRLAFVVLVDVVRSNVDVMRRVLGPERDIRPAFVEVPIALADARAIGVLAAIVTMTPGTLTADIAPDRSHLVVHALHVDDPQALADTIRTRYERPLAEIFG